MCDVSAMRVVTNKHLLPAGQAGRGYPGPDKRPRRGYGQADETVALNLVGTLTAVKRLWHRFRLESKLGRGFDTCPAVFARCGLMVRHL